MTFGESPRKNAQSINQPFEKLFVVVVFMLLACFGSPSVFAQKFSGRAGALRKNIRAKQTVSDNAYKFVKSDLAGAIASADSERIAIEWTTNSEVNILGYKLWRVADGEYTSLNSELIASRAFRPGADSPFAGDSYLYFDQDASMLRASNVAYYIEIVKTNNGREWIGPIEIGGKFENQREASQTFSELSLPTSDSDQIVRVENPEALLLEQTSTGSFAARSIVTIPAGNAKALKIEVARDGWYRIAASDLASFGYVANPSNWVLTVEGSEEPILVTPDGSIEFYGRALNTIQTDRRVYWLTYSKFAGKRISVSTPTYDSAAPGGTTRQIVERRDRIYYGTGILNGDRENWFAAFIAPFGNEQNLNLSQVAFGSAEPVTIGVDLQGFYATDHSVEVALNGVVVGVVNFFAGDRVEATLQTSASNLLEGANVVRLRSLNGSSDYNFLEAVRIDYPRNLRASQDGLKFVLPSNRKAKLDGFESAQVRVFDITNPSSVSSYVLQGVLAADGRYSVSIPKSNNARTLLAQGAAIAPLAPRSIVRNTASTLKSANNSANFVIIAPAEFHSALMPLVDARNASGLFTKLVDVVDVYDEFSDGAKSADAIKSFLQYANSSWTVKPGYVMLVGDASIDPRDYRGVGNDAANIIPTMFEDAYLMEALSDDRFVDFDDDNFADMSIGRLPARTPAEVSTAVAKTLAVNNLTASQAISRGATMVADLPVGYDFTLALQNLSTSLPSTMPVNFVSRSSSQADSVTRQQALDNVNQGRFIVNYHGHGLVGGWSSANLLQSGDGSVLTNTNSPAMMLALACLNGYYADSSPNFAKGMINGTGGAFAVWADSGLYAPEFNLNASREIQTRVFAGERIGDAVRTAKQLAYDFPSPRSWILFGDPTTRLLP